MATSREDEVQDAQEVFIMTHEKICIKCNELKELELFKKDKGRADGHRNVCLACHNKKRVGYNKKYKDEFIQKHGGTHSQMKRAEELGVTVAVVKTIDEVKGKTKEIKGTKEFQENEELKKKNRLWKKQISFENSVMVSSKVCSVCNEHKSVTEFYPSKTHKDGYEGRCKLCNHIKCRERTPSDEERKRKQEYDKQYREDKKAKGKEKRMEIVLDPKDRIITREEAEHEGEVLTDIHNQLDLCLMAIMSLECDTMEEKDARKIRNIYRAMKKEVDDIYVLAEVNKSRAGESRWW